MNQAALELLRTYTARERFRFAVDCYATATTAAAPRSPFAGNGDASAGLVLLACAALSAPAERALVGLLEGALLVAEDVELAGRDLASRALGLIESPRERVNAEGYAAECGVYLARRRGESAQNGGG